MHFEFPYLDVLYNNNFFFLYFQISGSWILNEKNLWIVNNTKNCKTVALWLFLYILSLHQTEQLLVRLRKMGIKLYYSWYQFKAHKVLEHIYSYYKKQQHKKNIILQIWFFLYNDKRHNSVKEHKLFTQNDSERLLKGKYS